MQKLMIYGAGGHARVIVDMVHKSRINQTPKQ
jgi:hypothetical protein